MTSNADKKQVFLTLWIQTGHDPDYWQPEYRFLQHRKHTDAKGREVAYQHRWDWACPRLKIAVEVDGGTSMVRRTKQGNLIAVGYHASDQDRFKNNLAQLEGWTVLHFSPEALVNTPDDCMALVEEAIARVGRESNDE